MSTSMRVAGALAMAWIVAILGSCTSLTTVQGSGNIVTRGFQATSFSGLEVSHAFTARVSNGEGGRITVRIDDNLVDRLDVGVSGDTLHVGLTPGPGVSNATLEADVPAGSLSSVSGSGASTIDLVDPLTVPELAVTLSGASRLSGALQIGDGSLVISGASIAEPTGSVTTLDATVSGASRFDAPNLAIDGLTIEASGASNVMVMVKGSLSASASGASSIRYSGSPSVERSDPSGASSIGPADG